MLCMNGTNGLEPTNISALDIQKAIEYFLNDLSQYRIPIYPERFCIYALCHNDLREQISNLNEFISKKDYPSKSLFPKEFGCVHNVRFISSTRPTLKFGEKYLIRVIGMSDAREFVSSFDLEASK